MMSYNQLYSELAVMARFPSFVHHIWSKVTVQQSKRNLIDNIKLIKRQIEMIQIAMLQSDTITLDEIVDNLLRNEQVDKYAHQKFVDEFSNDL